MDSSAISSVVSTLVDRLPVRALQDVCRIHELDAQRLADLGIDDGSIREKLLKSGVKVELITRAAVLRALSKAGIKAAVCPEAQALFEKIDPSLRDRSNPFFPIVRSTLIALGINLEIDLSLEDGLSQ